MKICGFAIKPLVICLTISITTGVFAGDKLSKRYKKKYVQRPEITVKNLPTARPLIVPACTSKGFYIGDNYDAFTDTATTTWNLSCQNNGNPVNPCKFNVIARLRKFDNLNQEWVTIGDFCCCDTTVSCGLGIQLVSSLPRIGKDFGSGLYGIKWYLQTGTCEAGTLMIFHNQGPINITGEEV